MQTEKYIYVVLTSTASKFGKAIRLFTGDSYNHLSISLNNDLSDLCTFGRKRYRTPLNSGFVYEKLEYYTLNKYDNIGVKIYKIPVTAEQFENVEKGIEEIAHDDEYMYNLFSALTYPFIGGFHLHKAFTCVEFVASVLKEANVINIEKACKVTPNEYGNLLKEYEYYSGNLVDILEKSNDADDFFKRDRVIRVIIINIKTVGKLSIRLGNKIKKRVLA